MTNETLKSRAQPTAFGFEKGRYHTEKGKHKRSAWFPTPASVPEPRG